MGGCYRVVNRTEAHKQFEEGKYPYIGKYKRYRVDQGRSKPGILKSINMETGKVVIQPVIEFYYDEKYPPKFAKKQKYLAKIQYKKYKHIIIPESMRYAKNNKKQDGEVLVTYFGEYRFGMNAEMDAFKNPEERGGKHFHRFYSPQGDEIKGVIDPKNFCSLDGLKRIVYMGCYKKEKNYKQWYDDLSLLKKEDWVYYETFTYPNNCEEKRVHIGQNFLFKAMFNHEDTVPESNRECEDMTDLCPRCRIFGITDKPKERDSQQETREAIGYKGRFKASALISNLTLTEETFNGTVPYLIEKKGIDHKVTLKKWTHNKKVIARQFFLPIMGQPKPNKRDVDGYFCKDTGEIKGAKVYKHSKTVSDNMPEHEAIEKSLNDLEIFIKRVDGNKTLKKEKFEYSHELRNYAQVCGAGLEFTGVVGAENCSASYPA